MTTIAPKSPATERDTGAPEWIAPFSSVTRADIATVGGKGGNLGELTAAGLPIPPGFIVTVAAFDHFVEHGGLSDPIAHALEKLAPDNPLALDATAAGLRALITDADIPDELRAAIEAQHAQLIASSTPRVAVRSSATSEDTAEYSFAGMFESVLNVERGETLMAAVKTCWASTFSARVLFYRAKQGLPLQMPVAVVVQRMINSEKAGVMFTVDPATGDTSRIVIEAAWGLGESVVQGAVTPDRHVLDKATLAPMLTSIAKKAFLLTWDEPTRANVSVDLTNDARANAPVLTADEVTALAELARRAENHYGVPQDLEFAIEGKDIYLTQSRPVTTLRARASLDAPGKPLAQGLGASPGRASGVVRFLESPADESAMQAGEILVTRMTSPDWVPIMRRAAAIVTDTGGMTSHAAIVARELGVPCIVGAHDATRVLTTGMLVTVDGAAGTVSEGRAEPEPKPIVEANRSPVERPVTATRLYVNLAEPNRAAAVAALDVDGVGLLRAEFMMLEALEHTHPREFLAHHSGDEFVARMVKGLHTFASAFAPRPVVYRAMDFRSNEFRHLTGGEAHEPTEANPMIGYRGCFRYTREPDLFALELRALAEVRRHYDNLQLMIPFVRTAYELQHCLALVDESPLGSDPRLERWIMAEVPSVIYALPKYAALGITHVSIGSNDLTQLMLGVDRDSDLFGPMYDERDPAVLDAIRSIITSCRSLSLKCSICGQAPSIHPDYARWLVEWGIDSISVNVDAIDRTRHNIAVAEERLLLDRARG